MLAYPSISKKIIDIPIYAFDKLDGNNIRIEWTPKSGFNKFGSRTRLLDEGEQPLGQAITIFREQYAEWMEVALRKLRTERATLFLELHGPNSFAGIHQEEDDLSLALFDVSFYKKGFMLPKEFLKNFEGVMPTPELLHVGKATIPFQEEVHDGDLPGMTFEGVVCKSQELHRGKQVLFKIKNDAWLEKLRSYTKGDPKLFAELA